MQESNESKSKQLMFPGVKRLVAAVTTVIKSLGSNDEVFFKKGTQLSLAIKIAVEVHDGMYDKGGQPYILHALKVMHYTKSDNELVLAASVLHDVVEDGFSGDHEAGYAYLKEQGVVQAVIDFVRALTNIEGETFEEKVARISQFHETIIIKKADIRHNSDIRRLKGLRDKDFARMQGYHKLYARLEEIEAEHYHYD